MNSNIIPAYNLSSQDFAKLLNPLAPDTKLHFLFSGEANLSDLISC